MILFEELDLIIPKKVVSGLFNFDLVLKSFKSRNSGTKYEVSKDERQVIVYVENLTPKESRQLKKALKKHFDLDQALFIEESKKNLLDRLYKYNSNADNQLLEFFEPILSRNDYLVLRDSLFIRSEFFNKGASVGLLKADIRSRYGERGNVICNLCTAGYFEAIMIPLWNTDQKEFYEYYDIAIDRGITALFVNSGMTVKDIESAIHHKLTSAKSYGLKHFHIHGIGKVNIDKINKCLHKLKSKGSLSFTEKTVYTSVGQSVFVVEIII